MKRVIKDALGVLCIGAALVLCLSFKSIAKWPDGYIPMFFDSSDAVSTLINTNQIVRITPSQMNPEELLGHGGLSDYLEVQLSNGKIIQVYEPFDEFVERIRRSQ